ncbi:2-succinyl-5-enolpyruvyl-6-hydroxy-3-cyclohexene-1-carboxylic-acid synthase [Baekduia soli]|uniref:2-succinyl-5-enolpyruvyl-6-hydroxy-3-cyclohexene-1-carboxylate synthase n=1 Tax=Baekduia soli TaxID=496014 RepID=A0A5B8U6Z5_9ACTN|nr:2-succinyl-5-enolpyruvyl-6-hydroxy-3-cyclohexene-1-carboxylic-acid synthase [Baekduia soli]QEC48864.1 2-succinyl-5-enolpyruvyl-6-hydroxy-3-cyclohexene-1-carboxylic-acid synthase [Baekduia soli]
MSETRDTYLLLRAFVDELARCGVAGACTSPGSRSTPLVLTLARDGRIPCWSHVDERAAGFFGLGLAKATGRPAVLACTSGTAAAHYYPAVIEAREARVPLIVLTTDRPPELRDVGAGQTIDQLRLFGPFAKWFVEVGTHPHTPARERWIRRLACRAMWTALGDRPGVVHLNLPLREPLVLDEPLAPGGQAADDAAPSLRRSEGARGGTAAFHAALAGFTRPLVVAGRQERGAVTAAPPGVPVLADPLSGRRRGPGAVAHYDALLRDEAVAADPGLHPDLVLRLGDLPTSKPLRAWLAELDAEQWSLDPEGAWQDPDGVVTRSFALDPADALGPDAPLTPQQDWAEGWRRADAHAAAALDAVLGDELSEPNVARALAVAVPAGARVIVAASMPIRDVETFWPVLDAPPLALANRGANGIDGTLSTAFGVAAAGTGPTYVLLGDVAFAHDLGGLLAGPRLGLDLTAVVVDNEGGGIFDFLPVSTQRDHYAEHVLTPTALDIERAAALYGAAYAAVGDLAGLHAALAEPPRGVRILHVRTRRDANVALHRRCWDAVRVRTSRR